MRTLIIAPLATILFAVQATPAFAGSIVQPGNICTPANMLTTVDQDLYGMGNPSTTSDNWYLCPIVLGASGFNYANVSVATLYYDDENASRPFQCYIAANYDGMMYLSHTLFTCSVAGGCPDSTTSYTGRSSLQWSGANLGGINLIEYATNASIACDLPPATSGTFSGRSFVISYNLDN